MCVGREVGVCFITQAFLTPLELQKLVSKPANYSEFNIAQTDGPTNTPNESL